MWTTLALVTALSQAPGQTEALNLSKQHLTQGVLGAARASDQLLPGDWLYIAFDIENVKVEKDGKVRYSMGMDVVDGAGKTWFREEPRDLVAYNSLGGRSLPAIARVEVGLDMPPGQYTVRVQVTDLATKAKKTLQQPFTVLPKRFGLVRLQLTTDHDGLFPVPPLGVPGQPVVVNFAVVGFERDRVKKQPNVTVEMRVESEKNAPTFTGEFNQDVNVPAVPMQFLLNLNRPGKFTVKLRATDQITKKTEELSFPLTVMELK
jgi:hypothetical protein